MEVISYPDICGARLEGFAKRHGRVGFIGYTDYAEGFEDGVKFATEKLAVKAENSQDTGPPSTQSDEYAEIAACEHAWTDSGGELGHGRYTAFVSGWDVGFGDYDYTEGYGKIEAGHFRLFSYNAGYYAGQRYRKSLVVETPPQTCEPSPAAGSLIARTCAWDKSDNKLGDGRWLAFIAGWKIGETGGNYGHGYHKIEAGDLRKCAYCDGYYAGKDYAKTLEPEVEEIPEPVVEAPSRYAECVSLTEYTDDDLKALEAADIRYGAGRRDGFIRGLRCGKLDHDRDDLYSRDEASAYCGYMDGTESGKAFTNGYLVGFGFIVESKAPESPVINEYDARHQALKDAGIEAGNGRQLAFYDGWDAGVAGSSFIVGEDAIPFGDGRKAAYGDGYAAGTGYRVVFARQS